MNSKKTVFVGLSGGVDSSVAALRLIKAGYSVVGVFIKVWHPTWLVCNWEQERLDAMRVAAKLKIPFLTCDAADAYKLEVANYFIAEYKSGRTPNPDVMCNKYVKFGAFLDFAKSKGADYIATGHYVERIDDGNKPTLRRGKDRNKDQSYFLWTLTREQLAMSFFPVGDSEKSVIRKEAEQAGLLTAEKKDSQGICFLGHIDIKEFLSHYVELATGLVYDENGNQVGHHDGALIYTIGQRHGFRITTTDAERKPYYVVSRNLQTNTIIVSSKKPAEVSGSTLILNEVNLLDVLEVGKEIEFQTRYRQKPVRGMVTACEKDTLTINCQETFDTPAIGQSCVLYVGEQCLGGGIIAQCL